MENIKRINRTKEKLIKASPMQNPKNIFANNRKILTSIANASGNMKNSSGANTDVSTHKKKGLLVLNIQQEK